MIRQRRFQEWKADKGSQQFFNINVTSLLGEGKAKRGSRLCFEDKQIYSTRKNRRTQDNCMYLPNPSTTGRMRHKVNSYTD